jgi:hypothetical protein
MIADAAHNARQGHRGDKHLKGLIPRPLGDARQERPCVYVDGAGGNALGRLLLDALALQFSQPLLIHRIAVALTGKA